MTKKKNYCEFLIATLQLNVDSLVTQFYVLQICALKVPEKVFCVKVEVDYKFDAYK